MKPQPANPEEEDSSAAVWAFVMVLFLFKIATVGLIFYHMRTWQTGVILGATTWYWLPLLALLATGPVLFWLRLRRVRSRRQALLRAEWMVDREHELGDPATTRR